MRRLIPLLFTTATVASPFPPDFCLDADLWTSPSVRLPVDIFIVNSTETVPGFLVLDIVFSEEFLTAPPFAESWMRFTEQVAIGPAIFDYPVTICPSGTESDRTLNLAAGPQSTFATRVGSFLINPINDTSAQVVFGPTDATRYAYEGEMFYAHNDDPSSWIVPVAVGIVGQEVTSLVPGPCWLNPIETNIFVPRNVFSVVFQRLLEMQIDAQFLNGRSIVIHSPITSAQIDALPSIQFLLSEDNGALVQIAQLHPKQYVIDGPGGPSVLLQTRDVVDVCSMSSTLLGKLVIHFDAVNNRVGFADPINEI